MNTPHRPKTGPPPKEGAPEEREAPWPTGGWGGVRPKVRGDAEAPAATSTSRGGAPWEEPTDAARASREAPEDRMGTQEAHRAETTRGSETKAQGGNTDDSPNDRGPEAGAHDHKGTTTPRFHATTRQRHSSEP